MLQATLIAIFVTAIVGWVVRFFLIQRKYTKQLEHIPGPKGWPIFGNAFEFFIHPTKLLQKLYEDTLKYGDIVNYRIGWLQLLMISNYDDVEAVLSTTKILNKSVQYEFFHKWLGTGLLTSEPEKWKKTRRIITPTFHFQILEQFIEVFDSCSSILVKKLKDIGGSKVDIYEHSALCALDVICETAMGTKVNAQLNSDSKYVKNVKEISMILRERLFKIHKIFNFTYYFTSDYRREKQILKELHDYTETVIEKRREELMKNGESVVSKKRRLAFLDLLLQSKIDDRPMTNYEIRQEVDTFMFEGHDTTAFAIGATLYCLSKYPDIQAKVVDELNGIFGDDKHRAVTHEDLQNMKYLEMVIKEALRLYPSVPFYGRKVLKETKLGSFNLPPNVSCTIFTWGLHRNPKLYPDPEKFDPERFTPENQNSRGPFSYVPFSAGPRNCIGQRFAMLEMKSTISKVLRHFEVHESEGFTPEWLPDLILKPYNGLEVKLVQRN